MNADGFPIGSLTSLKIENKVSACFKEITYKFKKNPSNNPLQEACLSFRVAACESKVVPKTACDSENLTLKVIPMKNEGGSGSWLVFEDGFGPWQSMSVYFFMLLSSFF
jgi:hypothetical protein